MKTKETIQEKLLLLAFVIVIGGALVFLKSVSFVTRINILIALALIYDIYQDEKEIRMRFDDIVCSYNRESREYSQDPAASVVIMILLVIGLVRQIKDIFSGQYASTYYFVELVICIAYWIIHSNTVQRLEKMKNELFEMQKRNPE